MNSKYFKEVLQQEILLYNIEIWHKIRKNVLYQMTLHQNQYGAVEVNVSDLATVHRTFDVFRVCTIC